MLSSAELPTSSRYGHPETGRSEPRKKLLSIHPTNIESGKNNYTRSNHENETVSNRNTPNNKSSAIYGLVNASSNAVKHEGGQLKERASTSRSIRPKDLPGYGKY